MIELLAVVSIIAVLGIATIASYQAIAGDVRRAGAVEAVKTMLSIGRERAMLDGETTLVGFRAVTQGDENRVEIFLAQPAHDVVEWRGGDDPRRVVRFVPLEDAERMLLPIGNAVAVPAHRFNFADIASGNLVYSGDYHYFTTSNLKTLTPEAAGTIPGILFARDGAPATLIGQFNAEFLWVDFNRDTKQQMGRVAYAGDDPFDAATFAPADGCWLLTRRQTNGNWSETQVLLDERLPLCQIAANDEPFVSIGPYLAVFDERTAREELDTSRWSPNQAGAGRRGRDLTEFIDATARQLHFNRFTGVAMEASNR